MLMAFKISFFSSIKGTNLYLFNSNIFFFFFFLDAVIFNSCVNQRYLSTSPSFYPNCPAKCKKTRVLELRKLEPTVGFMLLQEVLCIDPMTRQD